MYVYAVLELPMAVPRRLRTIVEVMPVAGVFVALERMAEWPRLSEDALRRQHDIVVALHRSTDAILPVRFGALLDVDELTEVMRLRRRILARALARVRGREQMTIRIFGPRSAPQRDSGIASSSGIDYLRQRAASARPALTAGAKRIVEAVASLATAQTIDAGRGEVQVTINHLVRRGVEARYRRLVMSRAATMTPAPKVAVSGPWPPFAFAPDIWSADSLRSVGERTRKG